jgi:putative inorganic carbon (hco3(-)) transporter
MRDAIVLVIILAAAPICLFRPYFGVLMWFWVTLANPRGYVYGIAAELPAALIIAVPTLIGTFFTATNRRFLPKQMLLFFCFWAWTVVTYLHATQVPLFSGYLPASLDRLSEVSKVLLMTVVTIFLVTSKAKLRYLLLITAACLGFLALKGAIWGLLTGGENRVYGTQRSFIADNNDFALGLTMTLAIPFFMAREESNPKLRFILRILFVASIISVVLTYSRGGLFALVVALMAIAIKSRRKLIAVVLLAVIAIPALTLAPMKWKSRMSEVFLKGELDNSAEERFVTWGYSWNLAKAFPITGGAFECFTPELFSIYQPRPLPSNSYSALGPHSIYFQVLAEQGFVGAFFFFSFLVTCWWTLRRLRRAASASPGLGWMRSYSDMLEVGFLAYLVGGAFLGRAYFDLYYELVACVVILKIIHRRTITGQANEFAAEEPSYAAVQFAGSAFNDAASGVLR